MAGTSMNDIKARMKSVRSTMQITKAMELVATSKLRRAKESVERTRPFYEVLSRAISDIVATDMDDCAFLSPREVKRTLYVVIAGDRGLAGGYNSNVFRLCESLIAPEGGEAVVLPVGKKALEHYQHRRRDIYCEDYEYVSSVTVGSAMALGQTVTEAYLSGEIDRVVLVYTKFVSMMTQTPIYKTLLPLETAEGSGASPEFEGDPEELIRGILPEYAGGVLWSAVCESLASESGARRTAMNSANKNAQEMIDTLMLRFNRARQAVITQEITEIVSGAEAL